MNNKTEITKAKAITLIAGRIEDEFRKHGSGAIDWQAVAASKIYSQWFEHFESELSQQKELVKQKEIECEDYEDRIVKLHLKHVNDIQEYAKNLTTLKQEIEVLKKEKVIIANIAKKRDEYLTDKLKQAENDRDLAFEKLKHHLNQMTVLAKKLGIDTDTLLSTPTTEPKEEKEDVPIEAKEGDILVGIDDFFMDGSGYKFLTKDIEYTCHGSFNDMIRITDDAGEDHWFNHKDGGKFLKHKTHDPLH